MLKTKIYLYDSTKEADGYRGTDYSAYVLQGNSDTEDITQKLDNIEITLQGLSSKTPFSPGTKFIIDKTHISDLGVETIYATYHMCVEEDVVMQPIMSDNEYFVHNITLYEASIVAQKRLCDNISATYKLKDVSLQENVAFPDRQAQFVNTKSEFEVTDNWGYTGKSSLFGETYFRYGKYFEFVGKIEMKLHLIFACIKGFKIFSNLVSRNSEIFQLPFNSHEKNVFHVIHVLIQIDNVPFINGDKVGNFCQNARLVRTMKQKYNVILHFKTRYFRIRLQN